jgi:RNA-directed DNA polymerase
MEDKKTYLKKLQKKKINECRLIFKESDILEIDHLLPRKLGDRKNMENLKLWNTLCPNTKTTINGG